MQIMKLDQSAFIRDLIIKKSLSNYNSNLVPMKAGFAIDMTKADDNKEEDLHMYQCFIGKLIYLAYGIRPNIAFVVGQLGKHNADPQRGHLYVAKRVMQYLKGTINLGLVYEWHSTGKSPINSPLYGIIDYANSNFADNPKDRKLVMEYCFFINKAVVLWSSKK